MGSSTVGMGTDDSGSVDIVVDADLFAVWGTEAFVGYLCPSWLTVGKFF